MRLKVYFNLPPIFLPYTMKTLTFCQCFYLVHELGSLKNHQTLAFLKLWRKCEMEKLFFFTAWIAAQYGISISFHLHSNKLNLNHLFLLFLFPLLQQILAYMLIMYLIHSIRIIQER